MFVLVSSNSSVKSKGIVGKAFEPLSIEEGCQVKAPPLNLGIDILHLEQIGQEWQRQIVICESTKHKNNLKSRHTILRQIKEFFKAQKNSFDFVFTGHGFENGDLCIETQQNPEGEALCIETILELMKLKFRFCGQISIGSTIRIYLDSCYSGQNIKRAKEYIGSYDIYGYESYEIFTSSGPEYTSVNTTFGGLLISKLWFQVFSGDQDLRRELKKKFQFRKPLHYVWQQIWREKKPNQLSSEIEFVRHLKNLQF